MCKLNIYLTKCSTSIVVFGKDTNRKIGRTISIEYCGKILVPNPKSGAAASTKFGTNQNSIDV